MHETTQELTIRAATRSDRLAICTLLQQAWHSGGTARWDQLDALETGCGAVLVCRGTQTVGFCLFDLRAAPVARLSAAAIADREQVGNVWKELWPASEGHLRERGIRFVHYIGEAPWLLEALREHGFQQVNTLISYERTVDGPELPGHPQVHVRPARAEDLSTVEQIDAAAFPLLWRYPRPMLEATLRSNPHLAIAELDRRPVGYALCTFEGDEGQVVRLAVLPEYRRQAIGSRLLAEALAHLRRGRVRRLSLNTQGDNIAAQKLYERFGFRRTGDELPVLEKALAG